MAKVKLPIPKRPASKAQTATVDRKRSKLTKEDMTAVPILRSAVNEDGLIKYVMDRISLADEERKRRIDRIKEIDIQLSGFTARDNKDDRRRDRSNRSGKPGKPTDDNIPLTDAQLMEAVTYLMSVYAPEGSIFEALAPADKQNMAQAVVARINRDGQRGQYYRQMVKFVYNTMKYNIAAMRCSFEEYSGIVYKKEGNQAKKTVGPLWSGNDIKSLDMYNFFYDISVHPVDLPMRGEYFGEVERITPFRARKMRQDKQLFGIERFLDESYITGGSQNSSATSFGLYEEPPTVRDPTTAFPGAQDWRTVFRGGEVKESTPGIELLHFYCWLTPSKLGLGDSDDIELWRIVVANSKYIAYAAREEDSHGMLPCVCATVCEDDLKNEQRTYAERLLGLQHFASFLMNSHKAAVRKSIGGITIYNPHLIAGMDMKRDDLIGARIAIKSTATDFDIDKAFRHYTEGGAQVTAKHMEMIGAIDGIMQKILPTDTLKQVASLERATLYQAAATVQAGDRRNYLLACTVSDQALTPLKFMMVYNLYAKIASLPYIDVNGVSQEMSVADMVEAGIEYSIGTGLKGLDRLMTLQIYRDIVTMVIQSQQAIEEIDIVKLLNYFATLAGDRTDLNQFKREKSEIEQLRAMRQGTAGQPSGGNTRPGPGNPGQAPVGGGG